eukprot:TRINITY_DN1851_c0_g1_i2.p1 TRINITY_DN1851_c0_g1~~TRINITY_DN1851_c0_g1_i2.p1  ORF type:complete len:265 (+),score=16.17 TRINITY_DN1851_c0_g1_i2:68-862(+)
MLKNAPMQVDELLASGVSRLCVMSFKTVSVNTATNQTTISTSPIKSAVSVHSQSARCPTVLLFSFQKRNSRLRSDRLVGRRGGNGSAFDEKLRRQTSIVALFAGVPDFLPSTWSKGRSKPLGPTFEYTVEEALQTQLDALQRNDVPYADHGVEVMYRFAGFDPFERSTYFGPRYDLGQFERFRRIFHHISYRVLLGHTDSKILSTFKVNDHCLKQRVWVKGARPGEEETFEFTMVQRVGGNWDGYWLTESVIHDGNGLRGGIAY